MPTPLVILEEHHEAFFVWHEAVARGVLPGTGNSLLHVDSHADLFLPSPHRSLRDLPADPKEVRAFVYSELTIADFIVAAAYKKWFSHVTWITNGLPLPDTKTVHAYSVLAQGKVIRTTNNVTEAGPDNPDRHEFQYRRQRLSVPPEPSDSFALDIDLDYFSCADGPPYSEFEITEAEYDRLDRDPYHVGRLIMGPRIRTACEGGRYYLRLLTHIGEPGTGRVGAEEIARRADQLAEYLRDHAIRPRLITLCRSRISGYTPDDQCELIEREVLARLRGLYDIDARHVSNAWRDCG